MPIVTVYLADNHHVVLQGIASSVIREPDLKLVGQTTDSLQIMDDLLRIQPDVLVLDLMMPGIPGLEIIRRIRTKKSLRTRVIVFTMYHEISYVAQALREGANGFVFKDAATSFLIDAIRIVAKGEQYLSSPLTQDAVDAYLKRLASGRHGEVDKWEILSRREREVLVFVAQGFTNRQIAHKLQISYRTVEKHRGNMMRKANFKNEAEVVQFALRRGLLPPD